MGRPLQTLLLLPSAPELPMEVNECTATNTVLVTSRQKGKWAEEEAVVVVARK